MAKNGVHFVSATDQIASSEFWCKSKEEFHVALERDCNEHKRFDVTTPWQTKATISTLSGCHQHSFMCFGEVVIILALSNWECRFIAMWFRGSSWLCRGFKYWLVTPPKRFETAVYVCQVIFTPNRWCDPVLEQRIYCVVHGGAETAPQMWDCWHDGHFNVMDLIKQLQTFGNRV